MRENLALVSPLQLHSFYSVSANAITMKRNRTGATLSPCLTPNFNSIDAILVHSCNGVTQVWWAAIICKYHHHQLMVRCVEGLNQVGKGYSGGEVMVLAKVK